MNKAGIITFHCADNFGAILQVYALQKIIQDLNIDAEIIDFRPEVLVEPYEHFINLRKYANKYGYRRALRSLLAQIYYFGLIKKRIESYNIFRNNYLKLSRNKYYSQEDLLNNPPIYDFYITGSDQVWNPSFKKDIGNSYLLDFVTGDSVKISYAASIAEEINDNFIEDYKKYINQFDYISIREKSSLKIINSITNKNIEVTLDPTLLLSKEQWNTISELPNIDEKYILVYDLQYNIELIKIANKLSEETGYKIICFSKTKYFKNTIESFYYKGPSQFLGYCKKAELILTNSFHGTVFSVIYGKPFYTIPHTTRGSRMIDLLETLNLEDRLVYKANDLEEINYYIDYEKVNNILEIKKQESIDFLTTALNIRRY